jgi:hypothetical protein
LFADGLGQTGNLAYVAHALIRCWLWLVFRGCLENTAGAQERLKAEG